MKQETPPKPLRLGRYLGFNRKYVPHNVQGLYLRVLARRKGFARLRAGPVAALERHWRSIHCRSPSNPL